MIIAIDFDGTIVEHKYPDIGEVVPDAIGYINDFIAAGAKVILWTMRSGPELDAAVKFCTDYGIEFYGINVNPTQKHWTKSKKAYANIYIDDAAFGCPLIFPPSGRPYVDWEKVGPPILERIKAEKI